MKKMLTQPVLTYALALGIQVLAIVSLLAWPKTATAYGMLSLAIVVTLLLFRGLNTATGGFQVRRFSQESSSRNAQLPSVSQQIHSHDVTA